MSVPLTIEYIDVAITLLSTLRSELKDGGADGGDDGPEKDDDSSRTQGKAPANVAELELGSIEQFDVPSEAQG